MKKTNNPNLIIVFLLSLLIVISGAIYTFEPTTLLGFIFWSFVTMIMVYYATVIQMVMIGLFSAWITGEKDLTDQPVAWPSGLFLILCYWNAFGELPVISLLHHENEPHICESYSGKEQDECWNYYFDYVSGMEDLY